MTGFGIYLAGYVLIYRKVYVLMARDESSVFVYGQEQPSDRAFFCAMSLLASLIWPLLIVGYMFWRFLTPKTDSQREDEIRDQESDLRRREAHVRRMERELGIEADQ